MERAAGDDVDLEPDVERVVDPARPAVAEDVHVAQAGGRVDRAGLELVHAFAFVCDLYTEDAIDHRRVDGQFISLRSAGVLHGVGDDLGRAEPQVIQERSFHRLEVLRLERVANLARRMD